MSELANEIKKSLEDIKNKTKENEDLSETELYTLLLGSIIEDSGSL